MRKVTLGLAAAAAIFSFSAVPAVAQVGVYAGPGGFGVQLGAPGYYDGGPYPYGYYDYYGGPAWGWHHPGWHHWHRFHHHWH